MSTHLTIVGGSARAAAFSAIRGGYGVHAGDLFADVDLRQVAQAAAVENYPDGLKAIVSGEQPGPWMYTGALENHPALVDRLASLRPLLGNPGAVLRRVRDPRALAAALERRGLPGPAVTFDPQAARQGHWLRKPIRSAGGTRIQRWSGHTQVQPSPDERNGDWYFQQFVEGLPCSGVFVAAAGRILLLGATRQLIGDPWAAPQRATDPAAFRYQGSVGPIELSSGERRQWLEIGQTIAGEFGLVGLFGVDAVLNAAGIWPVEVNPRYTASVEIIERATGCLAIPLHVAACRDETVPDSSIPPATPGRLWGKAIVFATRRLNVPMRLVQWALAATRDGWPAVADIPAAETVVEPDWPLLTVFAAGPDEAAVLAGLRELTNAARQIAGE